jgi:hypothetical protein
MSITTRVTKLFNIKHPIILPGMSWISTPQLVAAVSNAGGLGILATGPLTAEQTRESIREIRRLTSKPFGIGATLLMPGATENAKVAIEEKVPVINFSLGKGEWIVEQVHKYGGKVIATVVSEKHAKSAESVGADCLMVTGARHKGHHGTICFENESFYNCPFITVFKQNRPRSGCSWWRCHQLGFGAMHCFQSFHTCDLCRWHCKRTRLARHVGAGSRRRGHGLSLRHHQRKPTGVDCQGFYRAALRIRHDLRQELRRPVRTRPAHQGQ